MGILKRIQTSNEAFDKLLNECGLSDVERARILQLRYGKIPTHMEEPPTPPPRSIEPIMPENETWLDGVSEYTLARLDHDTVIKYLKIAGSIVIIFGITAVICFGIAT